MAQVFNQWEGIGPGRYQGTAPGRVQSYCRVKADATRISAVIEVPDGEWSGGLVLHHEDGKNYTIACVRSGKRVNIQARRAGKASQLGSLPCPAAKTPGRLHVEAVREGAEVVFLVEGTEVCRFELPGGTLGLAIEGGRLRFSEVTWK